MVLYSPSEYQLLDNFNDVILLMNTRSFGRKFHIFHHFSNLYLKYVPRGCKNIFMLNSTELEIYPAQINISKSFKARTIFIFHYLSFYEQLKCHAQGRFRI